MLYSKTPLHFQYNDGWNRACPSENKTSEASLLKPEIIRWCSPVQYERMFVCVAGVVFNCGIYCINLSVWLFCIWYKRHVCPATSLACVHTGLCLCATKHMYMRILHARVSFSTWALNGAESSVQSLSVSAGESAKTDLIAYSVFCSRSNGRREDKRGQRTPF